MTPSDDSTEDFLRNNPLFEDFSEYQLQQVFPFIEEITLTENEIAIHENEVSDHIFIVKEGAVAIERWDAESSRVHRIATLGVGAIVGELSVLDNEPRSASVKAIKPTTLLMIPVNQLHVLSNENATSNKIATHIPEFAEEAKILVAESSLYPQLAQNIAKNLSKRLRNTNDAVVESLRKELRHERARVVMGKLIITVIVALSLYIGILKMLEDWQYRFFNSTIINVPLIAVFGCIIFFAIQKTGYPLRFYGLTLRGWKASLRESLLCTIVMLVLMVFFKWILVHTTDQYANHAIFEMKMLHHGASISRNILALFVYLLFVPLQELIARGALQSSFQELLLSKHKTFLAILLSNLLFSVTHFHVSIVVGLSVFLPGLFWGWLYSRHKTLLGVSISHQIFGVWALSFIGL